jgi:hypothetical protein
MKSLAGGTGMTLGVPFLLAVAIYVAASPSGGNSFGDFAGGGCVVWLFTVIAVLATAVPRVGFARWLGYRPIEQDWVWRKRQRMALWQGFKVALAGMAALGLVIWANHSFISNTPTHYEVTVDLPIGAKSLAVRVSRPQPGSCPRGGVITLSYRGIGSPRVEVGGETRRPVRSSPGQSAYRVPLRSERTTYSCYYDFPEVVAASGAVPVQLLIAAIGDASDSTPAPTRYQSDYWGWICRAVRKPTGCAVLGVLNADPSAAAPSLALLVAGGAFAAVVSLLGTVLLALSRAWLDDLVSLAKMLKKFFAQLWDEFRAGSRDPPSQKEN